MLHTQKSKRLAFLLGLLVLAGSNQTAYSQGPALRSEQELIAVLQSGEPADKAMACKHLAVQGTDAAVPELAKLLSNEQLASWSRIALEAIPGSTADEALRKATGSLQGLLLVGAINSIGVRRDAQAVDAVAAHLQSQEVEVAAAAAVALGRIGNAAAAQALRKSLPKAPEKVRSAVAEGLVLCAERFHTDGNSVEAIEIYDAVRAADVPKQRIVEATRGAILARKQDGIPLLLEHLRSPDKAIFQVALATVREFPGAAIDKSLASELEKAAPERAPLIIAAMADRAETVDLAAIQKAAIAGDKRVRLAALSAIGRIGNATSVASLLEIAMQPDPELVQAAKTALAEMPDESINRDIVARLTKADNKLVALLIEVVGQRRIEATAELTKSLENSDKAIRSAALLSLGETVPADKLAVLIDQVVAPKQADDAEIARQALKAAAIRMPDREACATQIASHVDRVPIATKIALLEILGAVGGTKSLQTVAAAGKSTDPQLKDVSSRLLGDWMTIDAAPELLELAKTGPADKFQIRSVRGYIRIARQFAMDEKERMVMCKNAFEIAKQPADRKLVLELLARYPNIETLKLAVQATQVPELKEDATQTALAIAKKLTGKPEVNEILTKAGLK